MFQDLQITITTILAIFGGLTVFMNGVNLLIGLFKPAVNVHKTLEEHDRMIKINNEKFESIHAESRIIMMCLQALMEEGEEGNREAVKKQREQLNRFLIER